MKFRNRLIFFSVSIVVAAMAIMVISVTQSTYKLAFDSKIEYLAILADDFSVMTEIYIRDLGTGEAPPISYKNAASYLCEDIVQAYSIDAVLYDTSYGVLAFTSPDLVWDGLKGHVVEAATQGSRGFAIITRGESNYIVFISPVRAADSVLGYCVMFDSTADIDKLLSSTIAQFSVTILLLTVAVIAAYSISYSRMLRPIVAIADFMRSISGSGQLPLLDVPYAFDDEIKDLIDGSNAMIAAIRNSLDSVNYEKDKLVSVIESMPDAVVAVNLSKDVLTTNDKFTEFFPSDADYIKVVHELDDIIRKVQAYPRDSVIQEFAYYDKTFLMSASRISPSTEKDDMGALIVIKDVSSLKKMEADQNKFISAVSHELRTPLTTINGYIDLLQRRGTQDQELTAKALETTKNETQRLLRMVNDLLNINRYKMTDFEFIFSDVDVNALIDEAVSEMNLKAQASGIVVMYSSAKLPILRCDRDRIKQVITNVIDNAVKYSDGDSVVKVVGAQVEDFLEITIRDYGRGIPEEDREKVFDTFYRVEEDRSRLRGGFGLGLSVVRNIVSKHGGTVGIDSQPDQGTLVTIRLPLNRDGAEENQN